MGWGDVIRREEIQGCNRKSPRPQRGQATRCSQLPFEANAPMGTLLPHFADQGAKAQAG